MPSDLTRFFLRDGHDLNFFQAVHLLERLFPAKGKVGTGDEYQSEMVRFETHNSIAFPSSDVAAIKPPKSLSKQMKELEDPSGSGASEEPEMLASGSEGPMRMELNFMGLYGVSSPLPSYFTDPITLKKADYFQLKKILDIFSHRIYSCFFRAWKKYRHYPQFTPDGSDTYTQCLLSLVGQWQLGGEGSPFPGRTRNFGHKAPTQSESRLGPDLRRIPYGRFLGHRVRSAQSLQQLLKGYFRFDRVRVVQFARAWIEIPVKARLGAETNRLGLSSLLGHRMPDRRNQFVIEIGPIKRTLFELLLPGQNGKSGQEAPLLVEIRELVESFLLDPLDYRIKIILDPETEASPTLGFGNAKLGMGTWLGGAPREEIAVLV